MYSAPKFRAKTPEVKVKTFEFKAYLNFQNVKVALNAILKLKKEEEEEEEKKKLQKIVSYPVHNADYN